MERIVAELQKILTNPSPDFIVVGELHGSKQNALLIQEIAEALIARSNSLCIAFEWTLTDAELSGLREYIRGGLLPARLPGFFLQSDGRFTYEHISLLKWVRARNLTAAAGIDIHCFDGDSDFNMAQSLISYKTKHQNSIMLVETGNMHARSSQFPFEGVEQIPMASILKKIYDVRTIFLRYVAGEINVESTAREVTEAASQIEGPGMYFDAVLDIPCSSPADDIKNLTEVAKLLTI